MSIAVWADVGGTFTDCLVTDSNGRRELKILSTGTVRARFGALNANDTIELDGVAASGHDSFWRGATVHLLESSGNRTRIGRIKRHFSRQFQLDGPIDARWFDPRPSGIEIAAGIEAPVLATRILLGIPLMDPLPSLDVRLGTTRGTNALLTRSGAPVGLLVTEGFADLLRIGEQDRPDLFALAIEKPSPLTENVIEVSERLDAGGNVTRPLDEDRLRNDLRRWKQAGVESLAICLLHSHLNDHHERIAESIAREVGFTDVSRSSEVAPLIKIVSRAETTTLDAYLNPILAGYVSRVWKQFGGESHCRLRLMTSSGNLVAPPAFRGRDSILSGPAGGVVALGHVARSAGSHAAIGLDMGGTSTDVSRFQGHVGRRYESRIAGIRVMTPMMDIETVAAGGGSICEFTPDRRLAVGPSSAGADPGPACYGRGGPLTVTDVNLLLGRIPESRFPFALDRSAAEAKLSEVGEQIASVAALPSPQTSRGGLLQIAEGFLEIAVTHMAEAVRTVSTAKGADVREMSLVGFGGAAGQHLCRVANSLGIGRILDHPDAGMLSALGMGLADIGRVVTRGIYKPLDEQTIASLDDVAANLKSEADALLESEHEEQRSKSYRIECDVRFQGTEAPLTMELTPPSTLGERFHEAHRNAYGYSQPERPIEMVSVRCEATLHHDRTSPARSPGTRSPGTRSPGARSQGTSAPGTDTPPETERTRLWHGSQWVDAEMIDRDSLRIGDTVSAPAMIVGPYSTLVVEPPWSARVIEEGVIELTPTADPKGTRGIVDPQTASNDPVLLEVVARRLQGIADAMGEVLRRTSISVNVKERRDYSCAVFRSDGSLVANAPHVPVHLGAMGHTVRRIIDVFPSMSPGDCYLSNDPFAGGSHLPDITAVTPVFCRDSHTPGRADFFVASRAHHAEIGGKTPGSMPPDATCLAEEGVLIRDFALVRSGVSYLEDLRNLLAGGTYPSRCVDENLADIMAQQAAGAHGARGVAQLADHYSPQVIDLLMSRLLDVAGDSMQRWIGSLPETSIRFADSLDDGTTIGVEISRRDQRLSITFESGGVHPHGFNATPAIVTAAVLYVLRCVSQNDLPLCDGVLRDIDITIPPGLLDPPAHEDPLQCAAVVAGNVETSQRIVDVLLGAIGAAAASQGTMNNLLMGDDSFGYYETIGGGSGATAHHDGADAVHTHMTNTRITDPEVLESRLPVRLVRFAVRRGSGGAGRHRGGDGIIREFEFLRPLVVSLITSRRRTSPYGIGSGEPGKPGRNLWITKGGTDELPPTVTIQVGVGDRLCIETPGGGGWGDDGS